MTKEKDREGNTIKNVLEDDSGQANEDLVPKDIDTHLKLYGKRAWEVEYGEKCVLCDKRIDEYGFCACGSNGG